MTNIDAVGFASWVQNAKPRTKLVYFSGILMRDRNDDKAVDALANTAWNFYVDKKVTLTQRHDSLGGCSYVAIKL